VNKTNGGKPEISYPCVWQYRLIGENREALMNVVRAAAGTKDCAISDGNVSSGGRYCSLHLEIPVDSEAERLRIYHFFSNDPAIRVVL